VRLVRAAQLLSCSAVAVPAERVHLCYKRVHAISNSSFSPSAVSLSQSVRMDMGLHVCVPIAVFFSRGRQCSLKNLVSK